MRYLLGFAAIILGILVLMLQLRHKRKKLDFFTNKKNEQLVPEMIDQSVINLKALTHISISQRIKAFLTSTILPLGEHAYYKILGFYVLALVLVIAINHYFFGLPDLLVIPSTLIFASLVGLFILHHLAWKHFNDNFPDALNLLASAVSAGESLMHAIIYVGRQMNNDVGREFKRMGERLQIGEPPNIVLKRSCVRFPFPEFIFFAITLRANIERGGQLRDIISQLNRVMFDARSLEKKKSAMTSEARMSAKIVFVIPFAFMIIMRFLSPDNFNYVFHDELGRYILYYVLASEAVGMIIIYALMRGIK
ncbi:type II secretion system F family protein [Celerinatantimonas sp. MCCC 1A17872]|uniref:type II secretion system F family protein n=1 Tax=Celerinatantimonas sp. MCCC 1A17872 TaxID=3177514 RepID=UPI0038BE5977